MTLSINAPIAERLYYSPQSVTAQELQDALDDAQATIEDWCDLADSPEDIKAQISELEDRYDAEVKHGQSISEVAAALADALVDLMAQVKHLPQSAKVNDACNKALDAWEDLP